MLGLNSGKLSKSATRGLTIRYVLALMLVALLSSTSYTILSNSIEDEESTATMINIAGRQRMLSQRIAFLSNELITIGQNPNIIRLLTEATNQFESSHKWLTSDDLNDGPTAPVSDSVKEIYFGETNLDQMVTRYVSLTRSIIAATDQAGEISSSDLIEIDRLAEGPLLKELNSVVTQIEKESQSAISKLMTIELMVYLSTLGLLLVEALFIFRPAVIRVKQSVETAEKLEKKAAKSASDRKLVLDTVSHELRTPLNALIGNLRELDQTSSLPPEKLRPLDEAAQDLTNTVNAILNYVTLDTQTSNSLQEPTHLDGIIGNLKATHAHDAAQKHLSWITDSTDAASQIPDGRGLFLDTSNLMKALSDIISNAIKFTDKGSVAIKYSLRHRDEEYPNLIISVSDTGPGMTEEEQISLFTPFETSASTGETTRGLGLGLYLARSLIEGMGGTITLKTELEKGTTITVTVPTKLVEIPTDTIDTASEAVLTCLVAEDNPVNQIILRKALEKIGLTVTVVGDGERAVSEATKNQFDYLLLDIRMPKKMGDEACREIKNNLKQDCPPIIAVTANTLPEDIERYKEAGFDRILSKPIEEKALESALRHTSP